MSFPLALLVPTLLHHITGKEICVPHFYLFRKVIISLFVEKQTSHFDLPLRGLP